MAIRERMRSARKLLHLTQIDLAKQVGLSQVAICRIELGLSTPKEPLLTKLCEVLSIEPKELLWREGETCVAHRCHL